jgi:hypothetical protein
MHQPPRFNAKRRLALRSALPLAAATYSHDPTRPKVTTHGALEPW